MKKRFYPTDRVKTIKKELMPCLTDEELDQLHFQSKMSLLMRKFKNSNELSHLFAPQCPADPGHKVIKYGNTTKNQRYYCKECKKSFTMASNSMLANSKMNYVEWQRFIHCMLFNQSSLEQLAAKCDISQQTAHHCRLRVFYALETLNKSIKLSKNIEIDETFVSLNMKGQDSKMMNRNPRKRGGMNTLNNRNENSICIVVAVESENLVDKKYKIVSEIVGFGAASKERICSIMKSHINPTSETMLITDGNKAYGMLAEKLSLNWKRLPAQKKGRKTFPQIEGCYNIQTVNAFHHKFKEFWRKSCGVSSKYLKGYLALFDFRINYAHLSTEEQAILVLKTLLSAQITLTNMELESRYCTPTYSGQIVEEWRKHFSMRERKIYRAVKQGVPKINLIKKYHTSYGRIKRLIKKIEGLGLSETILGTKAEINKTPQRQYTEKQWEIYTLYQSGKYTMKQLAALYGYVPQNISKIIKKINATSSAYPRTIIKKHRKIKKTSTLKKVTAERNQSIYMQFNALCAGNSKITLTEAYNTLASYNKLSKNTIRNIVFRIRKTDPNAVWRKKGKGIAPDFMHNI